MYAYLLLNICFYSSFFGSDVMIEKMIFILFIRAGGLYHYLFRKQRRRAHTSTTTASTMWTCMHACIHAISLPLHFMYFLTLKGWNREATYIFFCSGTFCS